MAFLVVPALSALAWFWHFIALYGTADPTAPFGTEVASLWFVPGGIAGLLFDQRFGALMYAPVLVFALAGLVVMLARGTHRRLALELLFAIVPYLLVVTYVAMWWGGHSAPARFLMPVLLVMAMPAAVAWAAIESRATKVTALAALAFTAFATGVLVFVDGGRLAYNVREAPAAWLEWLNGTVDLARGLPDWWRDPGAAYGAGAPGLYRDVAIWAGLLTAAWWLLRLIERTGRVTTRAGFSTSAAGLYASAAMLAMTIVWVAGGSGVLAETSSQLNVLRRLGRDDRLLAIDALRLRREDRGAVPSMLRIEPQRSSAPGGAGRNDRPLYTLAGIPAGQYRLRARAQGSGEAWWAIGIGRDQFALRTGPIGSPPQPVVLDFPVDVRAIVVRGDDAARRSIRSIVVEPLSLVPPSRRLTPDYARKAVRYGDATVYFMDERSFPEPEAFWVGGARQSSIVVQPDAPRVVAHLLVRNGPVENRVLVQSGSWRDEMTLGAGEERRVDVPLDRERGATLVTLRTSAGFQPSAVDPKSRDERFLGVWVRVQQ
jgi:hypothetical protein